MDIVVHARAAHARPVARRPDLITTATIYGAAALATTGFLIAAVVDAVLGVRRPQRVAS